MKFRIKRNVVNVVTVIIFLLCLFNLGNFLKQNIDALNLPTQHPPYGGIPFINSCKWMLFDETVLNVEGLTLQPLSLTSLRLEWIALPDMDSYKISVGASEVGPFVEVVLVEHPTTFYELGNLSIEGEYYFVIQASSDGNKWGDISGVAYIKMPLIPGSPTGLTASIYSETALDLSWMAPVSNGGASITGYKIERQTNGGSWSTIVANTGNANTTYRNTGLTENTEYGYRVSTVTVVASNPSLVSTKETGHCYTTTGDCASGYTSILGGSQSGCTTVGPANSPYAGSGSNRYRIIAANSDPVSCGGCIASNPSYDQVRQAQISLDSGANYTGVGSQYVCRTQRAGSTCMWTQFGFYYTTSKTCKAGMAQCGSPAYSQCTGCNSSCSCSSNSCSACATTRVCTNQTTTIRWCCRN